MGYSTYWLALGCRCSSCRNNGRFLDSTEAPVALSQRCLKPVTLRLCRVCTVPKIGSRWHNQDPCHGAPIIRTEIMDIPREQMGCPRFNRCEEDRLIFGGKMDVDGQWPGAGTDHQLQPLGQLGKTHALRRLWEIHARFGQCVDRREEEHIRKGPQTAQPRLRPIGR
jgi:hypothetical protein